MELQMNQINIDNLISENNMLSLHSDKGVSITCGEASITLLPNGHILLKGTLISHQANQLKIDGDRVDFL
jgi:hypothetical protein